MSGDKGGNKADTLVKVVLFVFISLLSFSVGTFVGKQVSDSDHRRMALEGEYSGRTVASADQTQADEDQRITEKEVEALTEEFVNREKAMREPASEETHAAKEPEHAEAKDSPAKEGYKAYPRGKGKVAAKEAAPAKAAGHAATNPSHIADKVAQGKAPTDGAKEARKPQSVLPPVASTAVGKYTVQVASYPDEKEAKNHAAELKGKGWTAFYLPANVNGKTWFRVLVGLFENQDSAKQFRAQFMKEANTKSAIVQKIVQ